MGTLLRIILVLAVIGIVFFGIIAFLVARAVKAITRSKTAQSVQDGFDDALDAIRGTKGTKEARRVEREMTVPIDIRESDDVAIADAKQRLSALSRYFFAHSRDPQYATINRLYAAIRTLTEDYSNGSGMVGAASSLGTALSFIEDAYPSMEDCLSVLRRNIDDDLRNQTNGLIASLNERTQSFIRTIEGEQSDVLETGLGRAKRTVEFANQTGNGRR